MATIKNRNGKRISNVKWAPKGKFWYVKGSPAKYYPNKGWTKVYTTGYRKRYTRRY